MKKIILGSLVAMMAVTAANADIASVEYVDGLVAEEKYVITDGKDDQFVPTVQRVQVMIDNSQTELISAVSDNTDAIAAINNAETGILKKAQEYADANDADTIYDDTQVKADIAAINNAETGILATAKKYADDNDADTIYDDTQVKADIAANTGAIAAINNAETGILKQAQEYADANDADTIYDDTQVKADIAAINNAETGILAQAQAYADEAEADAIAAAKTAADEAYDVKGAAATAKTEAIAAAGNAAAGTYQVKSSALSIGAAEGAWLNLTSVTGYSATGTHSLVLKDGNIQWEAIKY